jgi:hypothetical protein
MSVGWVALGVRNEVTAAESCHDPLDAPAREPDVLERGSTKKSWGNEGMVERR